MSKSRRSYGHGGYTTSSSRKSSSVKDNKALIISAAVSFLVLLVLMILQATWLNAILIFLNYHLWFWLTVVGIGVGAGMFLFSRSRWRQAAGSLIASGLSVFMIFGMMSMGYYAKKHIQDSVAISQPQGDEATVPEYNERAPLVVARAQTNSNLTINGEPEDTTYIASADRYGTAVRKPGITDGYGQVIYQQIGPNGQSIDANGNVGNQNCAFSPAANKRFSGWFGANLDRAILRERWGVIIDEDDSYAYCTDEGKAMMIIPLKKVTGRLFVKWEIPAGVAVYNGDTGDIEILDEVKEGQFPGPVYPVSLSEQSRESSHAAGSLMDYWMKRVGYSDTSGDEGDPNSGNVSEFTLRKKDNSGDHYVTPLVMHGRGSAITAIGTVSSSTLKAGELNPYQINVLPGARQANSAVNDQIHTDYSSLDWAAGIKVFEIAPTGPHTWTATLGREKSIMYRLTINPDASSCLYDLSGKKIRCTTDESSDDPISEPGTPPATDDLSALTDQQLIDLQKQVQAEIEKRLMNE